jgi:hypothetical protein
MTFMLDKPNALMKILSSLAMACVVSLAACDRTPPAPKDPPGQWILESYNADKGYVLRKDGATYLASCDYYFWGPISQDKNNPGEPYLDMGLGHGSQLDNNRGECTAILAFIHKPVPFSQYRSYPPDRLFFSIKDPGGSYVQGITEFTIVEAK